MFVLSHNTFRNKKRNPQQKISTFGMLVTENTLTSFFSLSSENHIHIVSEFILSAHIISQKCFAILWKSWLFESLRAAMAMKQLWSELFIQDIQVTLSHVLSALVVSEEENTAFPGSQHFCEHWCRRVTFMLAVLSGFMRILLFLLSFCWRNWHFLCFIGI